MINCAALYLKLLRPDQWIKNIFVLIPLVFARQFFDASDVLSSLFAVVVFTLASGSVYVLNDLIDAEKDKLHPVKKLRPLASGNISKKSGLQLFSVLLLSSLFFAWLVSFPFFTVLLGYLAMTMAYSLFLKNIIFLDVILIAFGFVFRVLAGGIAAGIVVTDWMIVLVFLFTLFLAIGKRRQEIKNLEILSKKTRHVLNHYTIELIDQLHAIIIPIVMTSYIVYTFSERQNNPYFILSIPLIIYAFFRYLYLLRHTSFGESSKDYFADAQLITVGALWFILVIVGLGV